MKPAPFRYFAPDTSNEALALLTEHGFDAKLLAGGQSLVPTMNFRLAQPGVLIDLNQTSELSFIREDGANLHIGAMTRQVTIEHDATVSKFAPLLHETMPHIAHPQIRNRGTIGGSLAHADPAAELPAVMLALDAQFLLKSVEETRWLNAADFFIDLFTTDLQPEELLTEIKIPTLPPRTGCAFSEVARRHGDFALVGAAVRVTLDENDACEDCRIVLLSVGNTPIRALQAEQELRGQRLTAAPIQSASRIAGEEDIDPPSDIHAAAPYRRHLAKVLTTRTIEKALANVR